mgnify:CR=1 FL=1
MLHSPSALSYNQRIPPCDPRQNLYSKHSNYTQFSQQQSNEINSQLISTDNSLAEIIHPQLPYTKAQIVWSVRNELCMTVEDALARRTRALLLDAKASIEAAPLVASLMATEMNLGQEWIKEQLISYNKTAHNYLP